MIRRLQGKKWREGIILREQPLHRPELPVPDAVLYGCAPGGEEVPAWPRQLVPAGQHRPTAAKRPKPPHGALQTKGTSTCGLRERWAAQTSGWYRAEPWQRRVAEEGKRREVRAIQGSWGGGGGGGNNQHNPRYANYWAPLMHKRHIPPHPAQLRHTNDWAPRTRKQHQQEHRPQRPTERSDPTQHAKGRAGDCPGPRKETTTRQTVTRGGGAEKTECRAQCRVQCPMGVGFSVGALSTPVHCCSAKWGYGPH